MMVDTIAAVTDTDMAADMDTAKAAGGKTIKKTDGECLPSAFKRFTFKWDGAFSHPFRNYVNL